MGQQPGCCLWAGRLKGGLFDRVGVHLDLMKARPFCQNREDPPALPQPVVAIVVAIVVRLWSPWFEIVVEIVVNTYRRSSATESPKYICIIE